MMLLTGMLLLGGAVAAPPQAACESLKSLKLPHTAIVAAELLPAGPFQAPAAPGTPAIPPADLPARCRVAVVLAPSSDSHIEMELWMPADRWNGNFQAVGNGGWAGTITFGNGAAPVIARSMVTALQAGYATASVDTGHKSSVTPQASFVPGHPEKLVDFAYRAAHEMAVQGRAIIAAYYRQRPRFSYWNGCSTGGRQGLLEAQRFPDDFDGIAAGAPANYWTHLMSGIIWSAQATHSEQPGHLSPDKIALLHDAVIRACDANDGVKDGLLEDPTTCRFDPAVLECKVSDGASCLSKAQVDGVRRMYDGASHPKTGAPIYPGMARGSELGWDPVKGLQPLDIAESYFRFVVFNDPSWSYRQLDFDAGVARADATDNGLITAISPDLSAFFARGGKLLQYHGWNDQQIAPLNSINYYNSVKQRTGARTDTSYRLFLAPGMMHCGGGEGPDHIDVMGALQSWVESGKAPNRLTAAHVKDGQVDRTRPLCPYPQVARFKGTGSIDDAASFVCRVP
jgi:feruloyl esterase